MGTTHPERSQALISASGSAGVCAIGRRRYVDRVKPTAMHANRSDMLKVSLSISTARRLAAGLEFSLCDLPQRVFDQFSLGQQPL
jgi:hypothetical protein